MEVHDSQGRVVGACRDLGDGAEGARVLEVPVPMPDGDRFQSHRFAIGQHKYIHKDGKVDRSVFVMLQPGQDPAPLPGWSPA